MPMERMDLVSNYGMNGVSYPYPMMIVITSFVLKKDLFHHLVRRQTSSCRYLMTTAVLQGS